MTLTKKFYESSKKFESSVKKSDYKPELASAECTIVVST